MFTGIVECIAKISSREICPLSQPLSHESKCPGSDGDPNTGISLEITQLDNILQDNSCRVGDSLCVDGVCLTITCISPSTGSVRVDVAPETLRRTTVQNLTVGSYVNIERAATPSTRLGGHMLQGHVDCTAAIKQIKVDGVALTYDFTLNNPSLSRFIVEKGYIAIDGTSLTITRTLPSSHEFSVMLVPHTQDRITLTSKREGDSVNIEVDVIAKYVDQCIKGYLTTEMENDLTGDTPLYRMINHIIDARLKGENN